MNDDRAPIVLMEMFRLIKKPIHFQEYFDLFFNKKCVVRT